LSVGNLIGSNILDVLLPIGLAAVLVPISFAPDLLRLDLLALFILSVLVLGLLLRRQGIRRPQALLILLGYLGYLFSFTLRL
jgi:cation:H+ antiporter